MSGRILIADGDRAIREALSRALSLEGYDVVQAADGAAALQLIESSQPDVAVLDVMMPNVDGLTVCRVLRAERNRIPVLMLTARTETPDRVAGLDAGADDYLAKPFSYPVLLARLRALIRRSAGRSDPMVVVGDLRIAIVLQRNEVIRRALLQQSACDAVITVAAHGLAPPGSKPIGRVMPGAGVPVVFVMPEPGSPRRSRRSSRDFRRGR